MKATRCIMAVAAIAMALGFLPAHGAAAPSSATSQEESRRLPDEIQRLEGKLATLRSRLRRGETAAAQADILADADVFHDGVDWAFRYERNFSAVDLEFMEKSIWRGLDRADAALAGKAPWTGKKGKVSAFNYLLFPRLGDWAVMKIAAYSGPWEPSAQNFPEEVERSGFFDEQWKHPFVVDP